MINGWFRIKDSYCNLDTFREFRILPSDDGYVVRRVTKSVVA